MSRPPHPNLTRREAQIMEILNRRRRATVEAIRAELPDAPSPSSVRKLLEIMIDRGLLAREYDGPRFVYFPAATPEDAKGLMIASIEDPNPVLFFEHKHLYRRIKGEVPDERYSVPFGEARVHRAGDDVTVVTWGAMVYTAAEAAERLAADDVSVEILDLRTLIPWDREAVLRSVERCSKVLVLHEDTRTGGFGGEIAATIAEEAFEHLDAPVRRIAAPDSPVPFSPVLEKAFIPQVDDVVAALRELAAY